MTPSEPLETRNRTKIVATVGPACQDSAILQQLVTAGVDVFRLNMAHGSRGDHDRAVDQIRAASASCDRPLGILVDLAGPKLRLGEVLSEPLACPREARFRFVRSAPQFPTDLTCSYDRLVDELTIGDRVLLADGTVEMVVLEKTNDDVTCRVVGPGTIRSRQGINLPGAKLTLPAMNDVDREHARWAAQREVDFVGLSFVRSAADIQQLKAWLTQHGSAALTIAKIEKPEAIAALEQIVQSADGIMIARGDLGVEVDVAEMPVLQKQIIDVCQRWRKPVIVATQMLDSMQRFSRPTRAEVTDVANAVLDGTDACMLSGETAIGQFPIETVQMMNRILQSSERSLRPTAAQAGVVSDLTESVHPITSAIVAGAGLIAEQLRAKIVAIATRSGRTALVKAKQRDFIPTIAVSDSAATLRQMCLYWGIFPLSQAPAELERDLVPFVEAWGREQHALEPGDLVVFVAGTQVLAGAHNQIFVHQVGS